MATTTTKTVNSNVAHHQWATRPADERFWGLHDLRDALQQNRDNSREKVVPGEILTTMHYDVVPNPNTDNANGDGASTRLELPSPRPNGNKTNVPALPSIYDEPTFDLNATLALTRKGKENVPIKFTNWSFQQLCTYAGVPAQWLRKLPAELAAINLNYALRRRDEWRKANNVDNLANLLFLRNEYGDVTLRSITTDKYSRLWDNDVVNSIMPALDYGWMVPPARPAVTDPRTRPATLADVLPEQGKFGLSVKVGDLIAPAGVNRGDRDMFILLVNPNRVIEAGSGDSLMRGVIIENSEVGKGAFKVTVFYLESVCGNHILWDVRGLTKFKLVHKGKGIQSVAFRLRNQLAAIDKMNMQDEAAMIRAAHIHVLGDDRKEVTANLFNNKKLGLSREVIDVSYTVAERYEDTANAAPVTAWGFVHGLTRYSQSVPYTDVRAKLDAAGGKILEMAARAEGVKQLALPSPTR